MSKDKKKFIDKKIKALNENLNKYNLSTSLSENIELFNKFFDNDDTFKIKYIKAKQTVFKI